MKNLKDILDKDLSSKWSLTQEEKSSMWESISQSLPQTPVVAPKRRGFIYWGAAAAVAAAVAAVLILRNSPSSEQTPFQPEKTPIEKTTTLADGNGVSAVEEPVQEKETQMPHLAYADNSVSKGQRGFSDILTEDNSGADQSDAISEDQNVPVEQAVQQISESKPAEHQTQPAEHQTQPAENKSNDSEARTQSSSVKSDINIKTPDKGGKNSQSKYTGEDFGYDAKSSVKRRFAITASSNFSGRGKTDATANSLIKSLADQVGYIAYSTAPEIEQVTNAKYSLPLNFTIGVNYRLNDYLSVGSGISYSFLHSKYNGRVNFINYSIKQNIHYVGIPVNLYVNLGSAGNLDFYAATGGSVEKGVRVDYQMTANGISSKSSDSHVKGLQFSVKAAAGMEYRLGKKKNVGIYIEPSMTYYFDSKIPASIRTDQPLQIEAQAGVRFHLK